MALAVPAAGDCAGLAQSQQSPARRAASVDDLLTDWNGSEDLWVFAYGSLIWHPGFAWRERRLATVRGYHRSLCLWSHDHRGSPDNPGLVFGLDRGGCCRGVAFQIAASDVRTVFEMLWRREMVTGAYCPRWLTCHTKEAPVRGWCSCSTAPARNTRPTSATTACWRRCATRWAIPARAWTM